MKMLGKEVFNEKTLVKELISKNETAFRKLFDKYRGDIYSYSYSMLKSKEYAEEIVQEVFLRVWLYRDRINSDLSFKSYIFTIARNLTFNFLNKAVGTKELREEIYYKSQEFYNPIEDQILEADYENIKKQIIDELPPKRKLIFEMSRNEGKNYKEISKELGISISTVKTQMSKALGSFKKFLKENTDITFMLTLLISLWFK